MRGLTLLAAAAVCLLPGRAAAQAEDEVLPFDALAVTPFGALPPRAAPMPASRNHHYFHYRIQAGRRYLSDTELDAAAIGVDIQWLGGSIAGVTLGYQSCPARRRECESHVIAGLRGRLSLFTTGPTVGRLIHDYSATLMIGLEAGLGWAGNVREGQDACAMDIGMPISLGLLQGVRVVPFVNPTMGWEMNCANRNTSTPRLAIGYGIGFQQLFLRGLDLTVGFQRIFREGAGHQIGLSITLVPLF